MADTQWERQNQLGRLWSTATIERAKSDDNITVLTGELRRLVEQGCWGGFEVGFFFRLAEAAMMAPDDVHKAAGSLPDDRPWEERNLSQNQNRQVPRANPPEPRMCGVDLDRNPELATRPN